MSNKSIKSILDISFPSVGGDRRFLVLCENQPYGSFDTREQAEKVRSMWASTVPGRPSTAGSKKNWTIEDRNFKKV